MKLRRNRTGLLGLILYAFVLAIAAVSAFGGLHRTQASTVPAPVYVPLSAAVTSSDNFGYALAADGDILVVGAPWTTVDGAAQQGVAYVYSRNAADPTAFTLVKTLTGSDSVAFQSFGWSVAVHGDTVAVGNADAAAGAVYLFARNQGGADNWGEIKKLVREDGRSFTYFGRTLALHDDTLMVGAPLGLGQVFVYQRDQGGVGLWGKTQTLDSGLPVTVSVRVAGFGEQIAFDGTTLAIAAPRLGLTGADVPSGVPAPPTNYVGAVFVFRPEDGQWRQEAKLFSSDLDPSLDPLPDDSYSVSLALQNDRLFVGAPERDPRSQETGKVFVYQRDAGVAPPFGQPGPWGEISRLVPQPGQPRERFGSALYPTNSGLLVSAEKGGVGTVYLFHNLSASLQVSAVAPRTTASWRQLYSLTTSVNGFATKFGVPLTGSGDTIAIGEQSANEGRGGIAIYDQTVLFSADPNATPTPTVTPSPTPDVIPTGEPAPCLPVQSVVPNRVYLPLVSSVASNTGLTTQALSTQAMLDLTTYAGRLAPGCVITGPAGVLLGAVQGAITQSVAITIEVTTAPTETLPSNAVLHSPYLRISSAATRHLPMDLPFVFGVPVPDGADTEHLALFHLLSAERILDSDATGNVWSHLPGVYDAATQRFLTSMPFLLAEGVTFVLAEHPDFVSPANQPPAQAAQTDVTADVTADVTSDVAVADAQVSIFQVTCMHDTYRNPGDCTDGMENDAKRELDAIYTRLTQGSVFSFPRRLRLLSRDAYFIVSETVTATLLSVGYNAYIEGPKSAACVGAAGYYVPSTGYMAICSGPGNTVDEDKEREVLIHELFHAIQYTYPLVLQDYNDGIDQAWIIEGMAAAAQASYAQLQMRRTEFFGPTALQRVDVGLTSPVVDDKLLDEYWAQDFWVFVGASQNESLNYLKPLLERGGSHRGRYDKLFLDLFGVPFRDVYWAWVKNQSIENIFDIGPSPATLCDFTKQALTSNLPIEFKAVDEFYPLETLYDTVPPLTARVIEIKFPEARTSATVVVEYEGCVGLQDPTAKAVCNTVAQFDLRSKIYVSGESTCWNDELLPGYDKEGLRRLTDLSTAKRYFVVVANVDPFNSHGYFLAIE